MRGNVGKKSPGKEASSADAWIFRCLFSTCPQEEDTFLNKNGIFHFGTCPRSTCLLSEAFLGDF